MNAEHDPDAVARYASAVRAAVGDLGDDERAHLLDDLEAHLQEVAAESGTPLVVGVVALRVIAPPFHVGFLIVLLLFYGVPFALLVVLAVLGVGVLWRLFRRLGRPTGIM